MKFEMANSDQLINKKIASSLPILKSLANFLGKDSIY